MILQASMGLLLAHLWSYRPLRGPSFSTPQPFSCFCMPEGAMTLLSQSLCTRRLLCLETSPTPLHHTKLTAFPPSGLSLNFTP